MRHTPFLKQAKFALLDQINELPSIGIDIFLSELTFEAIRSQLLNSRTDKTLTRFLVSFIVPPERLKGL